MATCNNTYGSYNCTCHGGFTGNGFSCWGESFPLHINPFLWYDLNGWKHPLHTSAFSSNNKNFANRQIKFSVNKKVLLFSRKGKADHLQLRYAVSVYGTIPEKFLLLDQAKVPLVPSLPSWPFCIVMSRVMVIVATALVTCNQAVLLPFFPVCRPSHYPPKKNAWSQVTVLILSIMNDGAAVFVFFPLYKFSQGERRSSS